MQIFSFPWVRNYWNLLRLIQHQELLFQSAETNELSRHHHVQKVTENEIFHGRELNLYLCAVGAVNTHTPWILLGILPPFFLGLFAVV